MILDRIGNFRLSNREREVLQLVRSGRTSKEIGEALGIAPGTVGTYLARLFAVTGCHSRGELAQFATARPDLVEGVERAA